ncbi:PAPS-dependent sulfotransferase Stf3-like [Oopsacas minuta]|uniref:PAPS-dependent sulfotransferase Stf3-like n=1 Tax=Oopsacas minuta TaxID=111878 RepID=A0AAV7KFD7_9METZ|nr:PAPS-dependent sulfotransferase Stf3-like [Oopsacas minuta]
MVKLWKKDRNLHKKGREYCHKEIESNLNNMIGIYQQIRDYPAISEIEIKHPVFIVSWLRTGSTLLHNLVAVDPRNHTPYLWELLYPLPHTCSADIKEDIKDRKLLAHKEMEEFYNSGFEDFRCIHELRSEYPDECCHIFERCFASRHTPIMGQYMQEYTDWFMNLSSEQIDNIYSLYKSELQYITFCKRKYNVGNHIAPKQWFLKDETHMYFLENLLKTFPDAIIINLHRDPIQVLGSTISGFYIIMKVYYRIEDIDGKELARRCLEQMLVCKQRLLYLRSRVKELTGRDESEVFVDIKFDELCRNPKKTVMDLYDKIGKSCTDTHLLEMITYLLENPRYKHGKNLYNITDFGLQVAEVRSQFLDYIDKFLS